jgi:ribosomal protein S13
MPISSPTALESFGGMAWDERLKARGEATKKNAHSRVGAAFEAGASPWLMPETYLRTA